MGHIHPQKNLPKTNVSKSIIKERKIPGRIILSLRDVNIIIRGSILKNVSGGSGPSKGYVVDHSIYTKIPKKKVWDILLAMISFFTFFVRFLTPIC